MKRSCLLMLAVFFLLGMTACSGYNGIMREHLGNQEHYYTVEATLSSYKEADESIELFVTVEDKSAFDLSEAGSEVLRLELVGDNCDVLRAFLAKEEIRVGDSITVKCSTWIYMDSKFYYIAAIETRDQTILSMDEGIENIIKYMDEYRSVF